MSIHVIFIKSMFECLRMFEVIILDKKFLKEGRDGLCLNNSLEINQP